MSDDYEPRVWARGIPPVQVKIDEGKENRLLVGAARIMFLAIFGIGLVVYIALNVMAAEVTWLWYALVYVALAVMSWWFGEQVADFFEVDKLYHIVAGVSAALTWGFLSVDGGDILPTGQIARFMVASLDFPEQAAAAGDIGAAVTSVFRAVAVGILPVSGIFTLWILRGRMMAEISDRYHSNPDLRKYEMQLEREREKDGHIGELQAELDYKQQELDKALAELNRIRKYPPVAFLWEGTTDNGPRIRGIDNTEIFVHYAIDILENGRSPVRAAWVGRDAEAKHGWTISKEQWRTYNEFIRQRHWLDDNEEPRLTADAALKELGLSRAGYMGEEVEGAEPH